MRGVRGFFGKKPGKKLSDDEVQCADGMSVDMIRGDFFIDGVQFWILQFSLRVQMRIVLEGAKPNFSIQFIRKLYASSQAPPRPCSP